MSFEIKYDKNGNPISNPALAQQLEEQKAAAMAQQTQETQAPASGPESEQIAHPEAASHDPIPTEVISDEAPSEEVYNAAAEQAEIKRQKSAHENFVALRKKAEQLERERDDYMRKLQEAQLQKQDDSDLSIGDADLAEGKHLKKLQAEIKRLKQETEQSRVQSQYNAAEAQLRQRFPDFDRIVTSDNIAALTQAEPEIAQTIGSNPDLYSKAVSAYTMIKKLGIHQEPIYTAEKARIAQNATKPRPSATIAPQKADSPLSQANAFAQGLTPQLQKQLWAEMESTRKSY